MAIIDDEAAPGPGGPLVVQPDQHMTYLLAKVQHQMALSLDRSLQPVGMTLTQFSALANIHARPGLSSADLARALLISPQAVGTLIRRLGASDLIHYDQRPRGHTGALRLTALGEKRLRVAADVATETELRNLQALTEDERATTFGYLSRLLDALGAAQR